MKRIVLLLVSMFVVFLATGCGPSDAEKRAQQVAQPGRGAETAPAIGPAKTGADAENMRQQMMKVLSDASLTVESIYFTDAELKDYVKAAAARRNRRRRRQEAKVVRSRKAREGRRIVRVSVVRVAEVPRNLGLVGVASGNARFAALDVRGLTATDIAAGCQQAFLQEPRAFVGTDPGHGESGLLPAWPSSVRGTLFIVRKFGATYDIAGSIEKPPGTKRYHAIPEHYTMETA